MYMPLMIDLKRVVVFGGERGEGLQKSEKLACYAEELLIVPERPFAGRVIRLEAGALPHLGEPLSLHHARELAVAAKPAAPENIQDYVAGATFVVSDLADRSLNEGIAALCRELRILCNVIDTKELCTVWFMSLIETPHLMAAVSSKGECAFYAKQTRIELAAELEGREPVAAILAEVRSRIPSGGRARLLEAIYGDALFRELIASGEWEDAAARAEALRVRHAEEAAEKETRCRASSTI